MFAAMMPYLLFVNQLLFAATTNTTTQQLTLSKTQLLVQLHHITQVNRPTDKKNRHPTSLGTYYNRYTQVIQLIRRHAPSPKRSVRVLEVVVFMHDAILGWNKLISELLVIFVYYYYSTIITKKRMNVPKFNLKFKY